MWHDEYPWYDTDFIKTDWELPGMVAAWKVWWLDMFFSFFFYLSRCPLGPIVMQIITQVSDYIIQF